MKTITVARKPLDGTVASNVLSHGCGGLNIKASRVGSEQVSTHSRGANQAFPKRPTETTVEESGRKARQDILDHAPRTGRWPANLILQHLDGCRQDGTIKVKACGVGAFKRSTGKENGGQNWAAFGAESRPVGTEHINYADADGNETVANWVCIEGCPVRTLDNQSGILKSGAMDSIAKGGQYTTYGKMYERRVANPASEGGASRFFKQVKP